jgi:inhibitor of cysteine peptidase
MGAVTVTPADDGKSVVIGVGDLLRVELEENPTTGFRWEIDQLPPLIQLQQCSYLRNPETSIGGSTRRVFEFRSVATGTSELKLKRWRAWEGEQSVEQRFIVSISVNH